VDRPADLIPPIREQQEAALETTDATARFERVADQAEIIDCLHRYARGMDRLDRDLARSAYHDDAVDDHWGFVGSVDEFLDWAFAYHRGQKRHQHYICNHHVEIEGDQAHVESYFIFVATEPDPNEPLKTFGGRYLDRFERRGGRWAIAARACIPEWRTESVSVLSAAGAELAHPTNIIARDRTDTSYARPLVVSRPATKA
jgi:hypothetical protein